ncbi:MAG: DsbA family protein [Alphaproteobacteria bacterium]|nr:DsbA family protein [Alphaproteobacteria bacterium]
MRKAAPRVAIFAAAFFALAPAFAHAQQAAAPVATSFTPAQKAEIQSIIKSYLTTEHPEVMAEGLQNLQKKEQDDSETKSKEAIAALRDKVFHDPATPVSGNPKGDVTVVEFFDYQCGYCKMSEPGLEALLKQDKNVRVVYKEFPILGAASVEASHASLASIKQGKYQEFHDALMGKKDHLTSDLIYSTAKSVGIDVDRLKKDMASADVQAQVDASLKLGQDIGVRGTPMFIINDTIFPGAMQGDQLKQAVDDARSGKKP